MMSRDLQPALTIKYRAAPRSKYGIDDVMAVDIRVELALLCALAPIPRAAPCAKDLAADANCAPTFLKPLTDLAFWSLIERKTTYSQLYKSGIFLYFFREGVN